jgi:hypothetical protein
MLLTLHSDKQEEVQEAQEAQEVMEDLDNQQEELVHHRSQSQQHQTSKPWGQYQTNLMAIS